LIVATADFFLVLPNSIKSESFFTPTSALLSRPGFSHLFFPLPLFPDSVFFNTPSSLALVSFFSPIIGRFFSTLSTRIFLMCFLEAGFFPRMLPSPSAPSLAPAQDPSSLLKIVLVPKLTRTRHFFFPPMTAEAFGGTSADSSLLRLYSSFLLGWLRPWLKVLFFMRDPFPVRAPVVPFQRFSVITVTSQN